MLEVPAAIRELSEALGLSISESKRTVFADSYILLDETRGVSIQFLMSTRDACAAAYLTKGRVATDDEWRQHRVEHETHNLAGLARKLGYEVQNPLRLLRTKRYVAECLQELCTLLAERYDEIVLLVVDDDA